MKIKNMKQLKHVNLKTLSDSQIINGEKQLIVTILQLLQFYKKDRLKQLKIHGLFQQVLQKKIYLNC